MGYQEEFSADDVNELLADDLSLANSLYTLIIENGDIRTFLLTKLRERAERLEEADEQDNDWNDWRSLQNAIDADEARYINQSCF